MKFIDEARIEVIGGDGGRGGSVFAVADRNINTLIDYRYLPRHAAENGENGRGADCFGAAGKDILLRVPVGTVVFDEASGEQLADFSADGQRVTLAKGGTGGLGNLHFKSSTNRAPRQRTLGAAGERRRLRLELKVLADVGLLGAPNAGKSTLIAAVSNARPRIADYPFTTLHPNLGVVRMQADRGFVIADVPGLIEGAAEGAGLGHQFLRHLARTRLLLHVVDIAPIDAAHDPVKEFRAIAAELKKFDAALFRKPRWIVLNKIDALAPELRFGLGEQFRRRLRTKMPIFAISAATGEGCRDLMWAVQRFLFKQTGSATPADPADPRFAATETDTQ